MSNGNLIRLDNADNIRKTLYKGSWYFSVLDIVQVLTDSSDPSQYVKRLRKRDEGLESSWKGLVKSLTLQTAGGKQKLGCVNFEGFLRLVQSIPSPKAEPLKLKIAQWANERVEDIIDPNKGIDRALEQYRKQGKDEEWINKRVEGKLAVKDQHAEWSARGISEVKHFSCLTNVQHKPMFGKTVQTHKKELGLTSKGNLRNMLSWIELEAIKTTESAATELHRQNDSQGYYELKSDCQAAAKIGAAMLEVYNQVMQENENRKKLK